jgi:hypothetical protein
MNVAEMYRAVQRPNEAREWDAKGQERVKRAQELQATRAKLIQAWRGH